jgi:Ca2+-binding EF-hand superfamily protein
MSRAALAIAACLAANLATGADNAQTSRGPVFQFAGTQRTASIRVVVTVGGKSPEVAWNAFLERLADYFDQDGSGALSRAEVGRIPPLPLVARKELPIDFAKLDRDGDGTATKAELATFCRGGGFTPVVAEITPPSDDDRRLAALFARVLAADRAGRVAKAALAALSESLRPYDSNDDETWDVSELLAAAPTLVMSDDTAAATATIGDDGPELRVDLESKAEPVLAQEKSDHPLALIRSSAGAYRLSGPRRGWSVTFGRSLELPDLRSSGQFFVAQFQAALGDEPCLTKAQVEEAPLLGAFRKLFPYADRNGDSRLSTAELEAYLKLVASAAAAQVSIQLHGCGGNLLPALDANHDGRLSYRELTEAAREHLDESKGSADSLVLPRQFRLSFGGLPTRVWGGVALPSSKRLSSGLAAAASPGPRWFETQDRNRDGILSPREFLGPPRVFRQLDKDGDGVLSPSEAQGDPKP